MKKIILSLIVVLLAGGSMAQAIYYTAIPPTIDGTIDPVWTSVVPDANRYEVKTTVGLAADANNACVGAFNSNTNGTNPAAYWRALYDNSNIYFLIEVLDNDPVNGNGDAYAGDAVEIYLSNSAGANHKQYGFGYQIGNPKTYGGGGDAGVAAKIAVGTSISGYNVYILEAKIPLTAVVGTVGSDVKANAIAGIKMEVAVNQATTANYTNSCGNGANKNKRTAQISTWTTNNDLYTNSGSSKSVTLDCQSGVSLTNTTVYPNTVNKQCADNELDFSSSTLSNYVWEKQITATGETFGSVVPTWGTLSSTTNTANDNANYIKNTSTNVGKIQYRVYSTTDNKSACPVIVDIVERPQFAPTPLGYLCDGANAKITVANVTNGNPAYTYYYTLVGSGTETATSLAADRTFSITNTLGKYQVIVEDVNKCRDTTFDDIDINSSLKPLTAADIFVQCNGATSMLRVDNYTGSYEFSRNGGVSYFTSNTFNNIPSVVDTCDVIVRDAVTQCYVQCKKAMPRIADFTFDFQCNDETTLALKETASPTGSGNYDYTFNNETKNTFNFTAPVANGTYTVKVKDTDSNCEMEVSKDFAKPTVSLNPSGDVPSLKAGDPDLTLQASSTESTYQWKKNNEVISGETTDNYTVNVNNSIGTTAEYSVKAKAANGCYSDPVSAKVTVTRNDLPNAIDISAGINDLNRVFATGAGTELYIFNRYGTTVYKEKVDNVLALKGWNGCYDNKSGKEVEPGVYYYVLIVGDDTAKGAVEVVKTK